MRTDEHPENHPVANGLRTDHPIPDLPFVDDSHIPVDDPEAIEVIGRNRGGDMWGREDRCPGGGWTAFTTDPVRHDLAWTVRWHPGRGRSVTLWRDDCAAPVHDAMWLRDPAPVLFRVGGYWYDGATWYRPGQVWDPASEEFVKRPVPMAVTVTAADLLEAGGDARRATVAAIAEFSPDSPGQGRWSDDLALWAARRPADALPLAKCVVNVTAPELAGDRLVSVTELAAIGGIAPSTLRAYISRGEEQVPSPQAVIGGRSAWSRAVAEEWAEQRRRDNAAETVAINHGGADMHPGTAEVCDRFERIFYSALWENPGRRKRWALRWRDQAAVRDIAAGLAWYVAADVAPSGNGGIVPAQDLAVTIQHAILDHFAEQQDSDHNSVFYWIAPHVARMLDWLIRHNPDSAQHTIGELIGAAERRFEIPREVTEQSLRLALDLPSSKLDSERRREFLSRAFPPQATPAV